MTHTQHAHGSRAEHNVRTKPPSCQGSPHGLCNAFHPCCCVKRCQCAAKAVEQQIVPHYLVRITSRHNHPAHHDSSSKTSSSTTLGMHPLLPACSELYPTADFSMSPASSYTVLAATSAPSLLDRLALWQPSCLVHYVCEWG